MLVTPRPSRTPGIEAALRSPGPRHSFLMDPCVEPRSLLEVGRLVQKDYLLRQIEKMGVILAGLRAKAVGAPILALEQLRAEAAKAGVPLDLLDVLASDAVIPILGSDSLEKLLPAADVLLLKAEIEERLGRTGAAATAYEKASIVVARLEELIDPGGDPELWARFEELRGRLEGGDR